MNVLVVFRFFLRPIILTLFVSSVMAATPSPLSASQATIEQEKRQEVKVLADKTCVSRTSSGLNWQNGQWVPTTYTPLGEFFLRVYIVDTFLGKDTFPTFSSLNFERISDAEKEHCGTQWNSMWGSLNGISCTISGQTIIYNLKTERGAISSLLGAISVESSRDSLAVSPFVCH